MRYFVLTYNSRASGEPDIKALDDENSAFVAVKEQPSPRMKEKEVVLFRLDSVDTLRKTHFRYFCTGAEIIDRIWEVLEQLPRSVRIQLAASEA